MSIPISYCLISKAALGDEAAYARLLGYMRVNLAGGHWSQTRCPHDPKCPEVTQEQVDAMTARMEADIKAEPGEERT